MKQLIRRPEIETVWLTDQTEVKDETWKDLKVRVMEENYQNKFWFVSKLTNILIEFGFLNMEINLLKSDINL